MRRKRPVARLRRPRAAAGTPAPDLTDLIYELLDAHADTAALAADLTGELAWRAHLDYLCALQRAARTALARAACAEDRR